MYRKLLSIAALAFALGAIAAEPSPGERMAAEYFRNETARLAARALADVRTLDDWKARRAKLRVEILDMLGLDPMPERTDLHATVVGKLDNPRFTVEKLHFQSMPGLYVTANLYLPKERSARAPAILYVCGHSRVVKDGVAYGNKTGYQHHPAWFAEHGYVAMVIDTLDLGEIQGEHHGTSRRSSWWWPTRGYTPAGVETWNAVGALDYLTARPEVDAARIGVTGRSGGGAYTWFLAAVDDRPSVLVPVAGITDMTNHVVDGCIEGHCDCMYQANTYAWDFATLAALAAPRPLLVANSDADRIFPLDGVVRIHAAVRRIYQLYGAEQQIGLFISPGPHSDTQELQLASFRWMNRWLKRDEGLVPDLAVKRFTPEELKVFDKLPADERNTRIHESFVAAAAPPAVPSSRSAWQELRVRWLDALRDKVLRNSPPLDPAKLQVRAPLPRVAGNQRVRRVTFEPDPAYRLEAIVSSVVGYPTTRLRIQLGGDDKPPQPGVAVVRFEPRGMGATAWPEKRDAQIRRRFLLLGQSLETLQVHDVRAAIAALRTVPDPTRLAPVPVTLVGSGRLAVVALVAAIMERDVDAVELDQPPASIADAGSYPNALRYFDLPQLAALMLPRQLTIRTAAPDAWSWTLQARHVAGGHPRIQ